ncbi:TetR family transcriptional regulator [Mycobacterium antarcticum]|uniref:TetR family transcriptional regulator n=1 Tax=unclassified Mycolicibacterium TaxID=2636767 RepID=UPI0023A2AADC|nr:MULTISPECIES: TetR family transcriptional regulator [unclassified Mycolicibacterium]BDX31462.1 TetR family transcriptional regulator [Mycolicibacterium sp. TUM20985]GLP74809.1 TetR family transcriptional regulator [Mycolicibacterium sp. TUM20983]GLP80609.1 TetR family transcriptional regulator [Mycolicibacterium sp. TUM20984]
MGVTPPTNRASGRAADPVLAIVVDILEADGYDAVQLREVARRARVSLATIYKRYMTRDDLILAALETWMEENRYSGVSKQSREQGESLYAALMGLLRTIFEPWEEHPAMLTAFFRVRSSPSGQKLLRQGLDIVVPTGLEILADVDDVFIADLDAIISSLVYGLLGRFAAGEIAITDIVPALDRTVFYLTTGYEASQQKKRPPSRRGHKEGVSGRGVRR